MPKFFNTAGPCNNEDHYMLPALERCQNLMPLINRKQYFVIHAARQTGKTTLLRNLVKELNRGNQYHTLYCSLESIQGVNEPEKGIPAIVQTISTSMEFSREFNHKLFANDLDYSETENVLYKSLARYCKSSDRPIIIMFDEVDCLANGTLISFLRQLRSGYIQRDTAPFIHSLALVGLRNIRDYKAKIRDDGNTLGSASPFNIVTESFALRNFSKEETETLLHQHTESSRQKFPPKAIELIYTYSQGQPWLVNAIAYEIVDKILNGDYSKKVTSAHVEKAVQNIILRRDTHIDSLLERLKEERVRKIIEPVILGEKKNINFSDDDFSYVLDLGLIKYEKGDVFPSNPIYREVIIRALTYDSQHQLDIEYEGKYIQNGKIDMKALLKEFQQFWRKNSGIWVEKYQYKEAAPHLILMAFLQRVINSGGQVHREYSAERGRIDLYIDYGEFRYPIEIKLRYSAKTLDEGKRQLAGYMDILGEKEGWLVVFDRRKKVSWKNKLFFKSAKVINAKVHIVGC